MYSEAHYIKRRCHVQGTAKPFQTGFHSICSHLPWAVNSQSWIKEALREAFTTGCSTTGYWWILGMGQPSSSDVDQTLSPSESNGQSQARGHTHGPG